MNELEITKDLLNTDLLDIWQTLDCLYEDVEIGLKPEKSVFDSKAFKIFEERLKKDSKYYEQAPHHLQMSKLFKKHCAIINSTFSKYISME